MLKIGDFSRLAQVSTRTLRHYEELGLLIPNSVDPATGYRYYAIEQMPRLNRILALKDLGFELNRIAELLDASSLSPLMRDHLLQQESAIEVRIRAEQERLRRVRFRLDQIDRETHPVVLDVVLKRFEAQPALGNRMIIPTVDEIPFFAHHMFAELYRWLRSQDLNYHAGQTILYHTDEYIERDYDMETVVILERMPKRSIDLPHRAMRVFELPAVDLMATTLHRGALRDIGKTTYELIRWIDQHGYVFPEGNVALREVTTVDKSVTHQDLASEMLVELQLPILETSSSVS
jgi:DNA-binding transcriptional MerR regulator